MPDDDPWIPIWAWRDVPRESTMSLYRSSDDPKYLRFDIYGYGNCTDERKGTITSIVPDAKLQDLVGSLCEHLKLREPIRISSTVMQITDEQWSAKERLTEKLKAKLKEANDRIAELERITKPLTADQLAEASDAW